MDIESQFPKDDIKWDMSINPFYKVLYDYVATSGSTLCGKMTTLACMSVLNSAEEFSQAKLKNVLDPFMYDKFFIDPSVKWDDFQTQTHMERREFYLRPC